MADPTYELIEPEDEKPDEDRPDPSDLLGEEAAPVPPRTPPSPSPPPPRNPCRGWSGSRSRKRRHPAGPRKRNASRRRSPRSAGRSGPAHTTSRARRRACSRSKPPTRHVRDPGPVAPRAGLGLLAAPCLGLLVVLRPFLRSGSSNDEDLATLALADPVVTTAPANVAAKKATASSADPAERESSACDQRGRATRAQERRRQHAPAAPGGRRALPEGRRREGGEGGPRSRGPGPAAVRGRAAGPRSQDRAAAEARAIPAPVVEVAPAPRPPAGPAEAELEPPLVVPGLACRRTHAATSRHRPKLLPGGVPAAGRGGRPPVRLASGNHLRPRRRGDGPCTWRHLPHGTR